MNDTAKLIICNASAGSGKTYTLVRQYLTLAFDATNEASLNERFKQILAITFTKKAANEMKVRILDYLQEIMEYGFGDGTKKNMGREIAEALKLSEEGLKSRAKIVKRAILHNYSDLAVWTIDSFVNRIVRTFAEDLNLPLNFEVTTDHTLLLQQSTDDLIALAGTQGNEALSNTLRSFCLSKMEEDRSTDITKDIIEIGNELFEETATEHLAEIKEVTAEEFNRLPQLFAKHEKELTQKCKEYGQASLELCRSNGLGSDAFAQGRNGCYGYFEKCASGKITPPSKNTIGAFDGGPRYGSKCKGEQREAVDGIYGELLRLYQEWMEVFKKEYPILVTHKKIKENLYTLAVLKELKGIIDKNAMDEEIVDISEFNKRINEIVEHEPVPFIYERTGNRFRNYLIDEFQDTSKLQWHNLLPLIENSLSTNHTSLIVGDGKQAIYRFRQGDVKQFIDLPQTSGTNHGTLLKSENMSKVMRLEKNFRSRAVIVDFNNKMYKHLAMLKEPTSDIYRTYIGADSDNPLLKQKETKAGGYVKCCFLAMEKRTGNQMLLNAIAKEIRKQVAEKGYHYSDITILGRNNKVLSEIAQYFTQKELEGGAIPVVSDESFLINNSHAVQLIINSLKVIHDPSDVVSAALMIEHLRMLGLLKKDYSSLIRGKSAKVQHERKSIGEILALEGIDFDIAEMQGMALYDLCEALIRRFGLQKYDNGYLATLLNSVNNYTKSKRCNVGDFLEWYAEQKIYSSLSEGNDAVRLLTIHKAKGLAAPIIILAFPPMKEKIDTLWVKLDKKQAGLPLAIVSVTKDSDVLYSKQMEEEVANKEMDDLNLLYVATTRPEDKLFIYCGKNVQNKIPYDSVYSKMVRSYVDTLETDEKAEKECLEALWKAGDGGEAATIDPSVTTNEYNKMIALGEDAHKPQKEAEHETPKLVHIESLDYPSWDEHLRIAEEKPQEEMEEKSRQIELGLAVHDVLSQIKRCEEVETYLQKYATRHNLDEALQQEAKEHIERAIDGFPELFQTDCQIHNECSICHNGEILRPDRIIFKPTETWIVDFKTGGYDRSYEEQLRKYASAVTAMGYPQVRTFLLFTSEGRLIEI